jgi:hypothetical protein
MKYRNRFQACPETDTGSDRPVQESDACPVVRALSAASSADAAKTLDTSSENLFEIHAGKKM